MAIHLLQTHISDNKYNAIHQPTKTLLPNIGVELNGLDLSFGITQNLVKEIKDLLHEHLVVVIRNQNLSATKQAEITSSFGKIEQAWNNDNTHRENDGVFLISNERLKTSPDFISPTFYWHWDRSWTTSPTSISFAHFISQPQPDGFGTTQFANLYAAYNDLSETIKTQIAHLSVIHSYEYMNSVRKINYEAVGLKFVKGNEEFEDVVHPLVRAHPVTRKSVLNLDALYQHRIPSLQVEEDVILRKNLLAHATQEKYIYTHKWETNDFILWDNLALLHRGTPSDPSIPRILQRTSVSSDCYGL